MKSLDSFKSLSELKVGSKKYKYYNLKRAALNGLEGTERLPKSLTPPPDDIVKKLIVLISAVVEVLYPPANIPRVDDAHEP